MNKFFIENKQLTISEKCDISDFLDISNALKGIKSIIIRSQIDINIMYLIKHHAKEENCTVHIDCKLDEKIKEIELVQIRPSTVRGLPAIDWYKLPKILAISKNSNPKQDLFWRVTFFQIFKLCFFQNVSFFCSITFFCGLMSVYLSKNVFIANALEDELIRVSCIAWIDAIGPILTCTMTMAKFSTAMSAMIRFKDINYELQTLRFFGLSVFSDYINAILIGCVFSCLVTHVFCTTAALSGCCLGWKLSGYSAYLFIEGCTYNTSKGRIFISFFKVLTSSFWLGIVTCLSGINSEKSVTSIFLSVEKMVVLGFSGIIIIQIILSKLFLSP